MRKQWSQCDVIILLGGNLYSFWIGSGKFRGGKGDLFPNSIRKQRLAISCAALLPPNLLYRNFNENSQITVTALKVLRVTFYLNIWRNWKSWAGMAETWISTRAWIFRGVSYKRGNFLLISEELAKCNAKRIFTRFWNVKLNHKKANIFRNILRFVLFQAHAI